METPDDRTFSRVKKARTFQITPCDEYAADNLWVTITSANISKGGILFESPKLYSIGQEYMLRFTGKDNKLYDEKVRIIRIEEIVTNTCYSIGAVFTDADSDKIKTLIT